MKYVIAGNYGAGNLGDEMILCGLLKILRNIDQNANITVLSNNPQNTAGKYNVNSALKFPAGFRSFFKMLFSKENETKKIVKECDYFILGGGGLFGGPKRRANFIWGMQALMAFHYKKPVILIGQSVGRIYGIFDKWIVRKVFKKSKLIIVRDHASKDRLKMLGIKNPVYVYPDLAFKIEQKKDDNLRENIVLVALRKIENLPQNFKENIAEFLNWIIDEHKQKITLLSFQKNIETDEPLNKEIYNLINNKANIEIFNESDQIVILNLFNLANFVLGMRLHSIISAIMFQTPFLAFNYHPKVGDLLFEANLTGNMINMDEILLQNLKKKYLELSQNKESFKSKIINFNKTTEQLHKEMEKLLKKILIENHLP